MNLTGFTKALLVILAVLIGGLTSAHAIPTCTVTVVLPGGNGTVLDSSIAAGVCVQSGDELFGNFTLGNLPQPGTITFGSATNELGIGVHTITFTDPFTPAPSPTLFTGFSFEVEVLNGGGFPTGNFIEKVSADFTQTLGGPTSFSETTSPGPAVGSLGAEGTGSLRSSESSFYTAAQDVTDLRVAGNLTTGVSSNASAISDTLFEPRACTASNSG